MNFLDLKAGEPLEVGTQKACRFWRYVFPPHHGGANEVRRQPVRLLSWVSDTRWHPHEVVEGTTPDEGEQGIHGFKTMDDLFQSFRNKPEHLVIRSQISGCDGVVFGTIEMWGIIWNHTKGYRAQFARPLSFVSSYGNRSEQALAELRGIFSRKAEL
jgi:hypothetical protein